MNILNKIWGTSILAILLVIAAPKISRAQDEAITQQDFYDALAPYGTWVNDATYGDVWLPDVDEGFMPYQTNGYWAMTEYGNTWVSNYEWGWAAFHYGTWRFDDYYGWEWIPGYDWSPAWVTWRSGNGYYGWAPISPDADLSASIGGAGYDDYWAFAPAADMYSPSIFSFFLPRTRVRSVFRNTAVINNTFVYNGRSYTGGPHASDIERYTHHRPTVYKLADANRPGSTTVGANVVNIFRPRISRTPSARPQQVVDGKTYAQQNPNQRIGNRQSLTFNRANAQKLAQTARNSHPANNAVGVNGAGNNQPVARPGQPAQVQPTKPQPVATNHQTPVTTAPAPRGAVNTPRGNTVTTPRGSGNGASQQQNQANPVQQNNTPAETTPHRGRPENRPNITPARPQNVQGGQVQPQQQTQPQQTQQVQQQATQARPQHRPQPQQPQQQQATQQVQQRQAQQQAAQQAQHQQQQAAQQQAAQRQAQQQAAQQAQQQKQQQQAQQQAQQAAQRQAQQQAQQQQKQQQQAQQAAQRQAQQQAAQQQRQPQQQQQPRRPPPQKKPQ